MKPLELTVYPMAAPDGGTYFADAESNRKRFTDAELAAEYWRLRLKVSASGNQDMKNAGHLCVGWQSAHDELDTMQRFMELPHYDEAES